MEKLSYQLRPWSRLKRRMLKILETSNISTYEKGPIRRSLFTNGAVTLFHEFKGLQSASVKLYFLVGSMHESPREYGIAHVIEHMLFKEGEQSNIVKELEFAGAEINAYTYKEYMCFEMDCLADQIDGLLPKFLSLFLNPVFNPKELEVEKKVVVQELKEDLDDHESIGFEYIMKKNLPSDIGHAIGGTISNVKRFSSKKLFEFYHRFFTPDRMILSVTSGRACSKLEDHLQSAMQKYYQMYSQKSVKSSKIKSPYRLGHKNSFGKINHFKSTIRRKMESPVLFYSLTGMSLEHDYYYDLVILDELLCEGLSSKFFIELREKSGLIYAMGSSINSFVKNGNYILIFNTAFKNLKTVKSKVKSMLEYYAENEMSIDEVEAIKQRVNNSWQGHFDQLDQRNEFIASVEIYQTKHFSIEHQRELVSRVTPKRLRYLLSKMLKQGYTELTMLPK